MPSSRGIKLEYNYKDKALKVVRNSPIPIDIENVRIKTGIKSWVTSKAVLLELLCEGKISGQKTTKSWIFWVRKKSRPNTTGAA